MAFERFYRKYWKGLYAFCLSKTQDKPSSEEIVHDVFIEAWMKRETFKISKGTEGYLLKSAKWKVIRFYQNKAKHQISEFRECNLCEQTGFDGDILVHNMALDKFLENDMQLIVNRLPCRCQEVYRLSREQNLTTNEIALRLNISQKTVKNHLTKALSFISSQLKTKQ